MKIDSHNASIKKLRGILLRYAFAVILVLVAAVLRWRLEDSFGALPLFLTFYPAVLLVASLGGGGPGIVATLLSALVVDYCFLGPCELFNNLSSNNLLAMGIFTGSNLFLCVLAERLRRARWAEALHAAQELQLEDLSRLNAQLSQQSEELTQQSEELTQQSEEVAQQNEELTQQSEELAQQNEELQTQSEEIQSLYTELTHREDMLQKLLDAARLGTSEKAVMRQICATAKEMFGQDAAAIVVYEVQRDRLLARAHAGCGPENTNFEPRPLKNSFANLAITENKTACLPDASLRPDLVLLQLPGEEPFRAVLTAPMRSEGKPFGAVAIYSRQKQDWTAVQFRLAEWLATQCAHILETIRLQDQVCRLYAEQQMIFNSVPAMIWYKDTKNNFIRVNQAAALSISKPPEAIEGKNACELFPHEAEHYFQDDLEVINSGQPKLGILEELEIAGGEKRWVLTDKVPFRDENGEITGVIVFCIDVTERKQAEESLRKSEERYRSLFNQMTEGFALHEILCDENGKPSDYRFLDINHAFETLTGLKRDDVIGKTMREILPDEKPSWIEIYGSVALTGRPVHFDNYSKALDKHYNVFAYRPASRQFAVLFTDITDRKKAEEDVRRSHELLHTIIDNIPALIYVKDLEGRTTVANRHMGEILGIDVRNIVGKTSFEIDKLSKDAAIYMNNNRQVIETGEPITAEEPLGESVFLSMKFPLRNDQGDIFAVAGVSTDITERNKAAAALRESEERFRQMFEHISSGVAIIRAVDDGMDFVVKEFNPAAEIAVKLSRSDVVDRRITQILPNIGDIGLFAVLQRVWCKGVPECLPMQRYCDERLTLWIENYVFKLPSGDIVVIFDDISEQVRAREHVDLLRMELMHAGRLTALGEMASGIAHEINQPLTVVTTWADVVKREIRGNSPGNHQESLLALDRISDAIERAGNIVNRMKNFARKSELKMSALSMKEIIDEVCPLVEHQLRIAGVEVAVDIQQTLPAVFADRAQIQQVLLNLIRNAHDAMENTPFGSRILEIRGSVADGMLEVALSDSGCGIPPENLEKIFDPFHTSKPDGMGLGLSISRTIVENHGGQISALSNPGVGSRVVFTLPLAKGKNEEKV